MSDELLKLANETKKGLATAQELQAKYDAVGWQISEPSYAKVRHMLLHLMKITADIASLVEHVEHCVQNGVSSEAISQDFAKVVKDRSDIAGELLFHAAQFANLGGYQLSEQLLKVYSRNSKNFAPDSGFVDLDERSDQL